jgi:DNA-binding MarR family transcriptional regulator
MPAVERVEIDELPPDTDSTSLGPALDFLRLLWAVDHSLQSSSKRTESTQGATGPQRLVLRVLNLQPGIAAGRIAQILHLHPSTLTGILQRLEQRGMISRKSDPVDARRQLLHLSAKGRKLVEGKVSAEETAIKKVLARMPGRLDAARELLGAVAEELELVGR